MMTYYYLLTHTEKNKGLVLRMLQLSHEPEHKITDRHGGFQAFPDQIISQILQFDYSQITMCIDMIKEKM